MKKIKIITGVLLVIVGMLIMISGLFNKKQPTILDDTTTTIELEVINTNIPSKQKKAKKVVKTTKKTTKKKVVKIASYSEYQKYAAEYGNYNQEQMNCLINLWNRESGWNPNSYNKSSGACGIPQALPCSKIKKVEGSNDWKAQIRWGVKYINARYKTPCGAWNHFTKKHWY